jgi:hypothetical protein
MTVFHICRPKFKHIQTLILLIVSLSSHRMFWLTLDIKILDLNGNRLLCPLIFRFFIGHMKIIATLSKEKTERKICKAVVHLFELKGIICGNVPSIWRLYKTDLIVSRFGLSYKLIVNLNKSKRKWSSNLLNSQRERNQHYN